MIVRGLRMEARQPVGRGRDRGPAVRLSAAVFAIACLLSGWAAVPAFAAALGATFDPGQVIELLKREIAVAQVPGEGPSALRIEEVQADLGLVEVTGKSGSRLVVPGADFGTGKDDAPKPALKRRVVVELAAPKEARPTEGVAGGSLARALTELKSAVRTGADAAPSYELKRVGIDLEFAIERDAKGAPILIVFSGDRRIETRNVQKLRLKLSKEKALFAICIDLK